MIVQSLIRMLLMDPSNRRKEVLIAGAPVTDLRAEGDALELRCGCGSEDELPPNGTR